MLFEQKKQHLWHSCCPISLVISNMKFNRKLSEQFWRIWCFPIQSDRSCTWMPERRFKDGCRVTWLALKRLWRYYQVSTAVSTDNLWPNHLRRMLLPGVNVALQTRDSCCIHTLPQHINMIRQMKGTHLSWRGRQQAENERNEAKASRRLREIGKRDRVREWRMKLMYTNQRKLQIKHISRQSCHSLPDDLAFLMPKTNWSCDL